MDYPTLKKVLVRPVQITPVCECGEELAPFGGYLMSNPPRQRYKCANGHEWTMEAGLPRIVWERVE